MNEIQKQAEQKMKKTIDVLHQELKKMRTGRAHPSLVENVQVSYYGTATPLSQVAAINAEDARTLSVAPWDKSVMQDVEKAILGSGLGLNPSNNGDVIRIPMPPLTEETRITLVKQAKAEGETAKVAIRNIRRDANQHLQALLKAKTISEDEERKASDNIQKLTDNQIKEVDEIIKRKEADLKEI